MCLLVNGVWFWRLFVSNFHTWPQLFINRHPTWTWNPWWNQDWWLPSARRHKTHLTRASTMKRYTHTHNYMLHIHIWTKHTHTHTHTCTYTQICSCCSTVPVASCTVFVAPSTWSCCPCWLLMFLFTYNVCVVYLCRWTFVFFPAVSLIRLGGIYQPKAVYSFREVIIMLWC